MLPALLEAPGGVLSTSRSDRSDRRRRPQLPMTAITAGAASSTIPQRRSSMRHRLTPATSTRPYGSAANIVMSGGSAAPAESNLDLGATKTPSYQALTEPVTTYGMINNVTGSSTPARNGKIRRAAPRMRSLAAPRPSDHSVHSSIAMRAAPGTKKWRNSVVPGRATTSPASPVTKSNPKTVFATKTASDRCSVLRCCWSCSR